MVLIPRAGPLDRDERMFNHRTFLILADYLTRAGIAVLRTDVRGGGKSGGKFPGQADDFVGDAEAALTYLKTRAEVNGGKIGLLSHGEGGLVASKVAARHPEVAFLVMLGAPAVPSAENSVENTRLTLEGNGELPRKAEAQAADTRRVFALLRGEKDPVALEKQLREYLAGKLPEAQIAGQVRQWTSPAFLRQITNDPAVELKKLACPCSPSTRKWTSPCPRAESAAMRAALEASGTKKFEVEELPDLNLLFQTADVGIGREANWTEETISPVVLKRFADWVSGQAASR